MGVAGGWLGNPKNGAKIFWVIFTQNWSELLRITDNCAQICCGTWNHEWTNQHELPGGLCQWEMVLYHFSRRKLLMANRLILTRGVFRLEKYHFCGGEGIG